MVRLGCFTIRLYVSYSAQLGTHFRWAIDSLLDKEFFASVSTPPSSEDSDHLVKLGSRWKDHLATGKFRLSVPTDTPLGLSQTDSLGGFWTTQYSYQDLPEVAPQVLSELQKAGLVVFKGDLNYRKWAAWADERRMKG